MAYNPQTPNVFVYAGNPNGAVAGNTASGALPPDYVWDTSHKQYWVCTSSGTTSTAVWSTVGNMPIATVASASTVDLGAQASTTINITGTTTITSFGSTAASGVLYDVVFSGALILTYNATSLILPTSANITTAAGDTAQFLALGSGNFRCVGYMRASGAALVGGTGGANWYQNFAF